MLLETRKNGSQFCYVDDTVRAGWLLPSLGVEHFWPISEAVASGGDLSLGATYPEPTTCLRVGLTTKVTF